MLPCVSLSLKSSFGIAKETAQKSLTSQESFKPAIIHKRRANVIEGGRDPANMILRQRRLKVRRTEKRSSEPRKNGKVEPSKMLVGHEELNHKKKHHGKKLSRPLNERWESYWESKRLYKPSSSFRPDKSYTGDKEIPAKVETPQDRKNVTYSIEKKRSPRLEDTYPGTKATGLTDLIKKTERKDKVFEAEPNVLQPLLLLPILKQIGSKAIKIRRLEAPAPFRRNTKAILKVRLAEKPKWREKINAVKNSTYQADPSKHTLAHTAPITVDLPNITPRKRKIKRVKKRKKKSNETPERKRNLISFSKKKNTIIFQSPEIQQTNNTSFREGKTLRKEETKKVEENESGVSGQKSIPRLQTEEGRKLLNSVRRALLAAYAMAVATTGTTTTHYRGKTVSLGSAENSSKH